MAPNVLSLFNCPIYRNWLQVVVELDKALGHWNINTLKFDNINGGGARPVAQKSQAQAPKAVEHDIQAHSIPIYK